VYLLHGLKRIVSYDVSVFSGNVMKTLFCLFLVLFSSSMAVAVETPQSATNCHCFKNRLFDPQRKFSADKYILTTSFNSFIAASFHISKRQIVMMLMNDSVGSDDLLIGLYLARARQVELESLLAILDNGGTWQQILESPSSHNKGIDEEVLKTIQSVINDKAATVDLITDELLKAFFGITDSAIDALRNAGGSGREITLVYLLEKYGNPERPAADIMTMHTREKKSWGEIAHLFGLSAKDTGKVLL